MESKFSGILSNPLSIDIASYSKDINIHTPKYFSFFDPQHQNIYSLSDKYSFGQQFLRSIMCFFSFVAFISMNATLVCVGCSQSGKLRASLMYIKQNTSEPESGTESDQIVEEVDKLHPHRRTVLPQAGIAERLHTSPPEHLGVRLLF